jgi:hypothetical protein
MNRTFQGMPTYDQQIIQQGNTSSIWYRFFVSLFQGQPTGPEVAIAVGASPFTYPAQVGGWLIISGGTISAVVFTRTTNTSIPVSASIVPVAAGDQVKITYSGLPTITFVPS